LIIFQLFLLLGSKKVNQSVFETDNEYYSQSDLTSFQERNGLVLQSPHAINGQETSTCSPSPSPSSSSFPCNEGDLDLEYIMGMAQRTATIYWWVEDSGDPFFNWIKDVSETPYPPKSNSISWGSTEQVKFYLICNQALI
jgi:hypothetical protein